MEGKESKNKGDGLGLAALYSKIIGIRNHGPPAIMKRKAKPDFSKLPHVPRTAPVQRDQWSEQSRRSYTWLKFYQDIQYDCRICGIRAVFSALEQQHYYEVRKAHICTRRELCPPCFNFSRATARGIRSCERAWKEDRRHLRHDTAFLSNWLDLMKQFKRFKPYRHNFAIEAMITKLLAASRADT